MNKQKIKEKIEEYEYRQNGMHLISGASVQVVNVKVYKNLVICDVKLIYDLDNKTETHKAVEYPKKFFEE